MNFSGFTWDKMSLEDLLECHNQARNDYEVYDVCDIAAELHRRLEAAMKELQEIKKENEG